MARWIKTPLGRKVGLDPSDIVLDGDPAPLPKKGTEPPIFGTCLLCPNGWMDQDATWYRGRPRSKRHCFRWGPSSPSPKREQSPQFSAHVCCGEMAGWIQMPLGMEVGLGPGHTAHPLPQERKRSPQFLAHVYCGKTAGWIKMSLRMEVGLGPGHNVLLDGDPAPPLRGTAPQFSAHVCCSQSAGWIKKPLCTKVGLGPRHIVLGGAQLPPPEKKGAQPLNFWSMSIVAKRPPISATAEHLYLLLLF